MEESGYAVKRGQGGAISFLVPGQQRATRLRSGKGPAYERWAKVYNLKQIATALQFMQEHQINEYDQLTTEAEAASARFHALTEQLRQTEADFAYTSELMGAVVQYAKTRPVFDEYKTAKYSKCGHTCPACR